jgi:hypothetical protein
MTWTMNLPCRYHTQDTFYYCGPACEMMILASLGVPYSQLDQDDLYNEIHGLNKMPGWYSDPVGLCRSLQIRAPQPPRPSAIHTNDPYHFIVGRSTNEAGGTRGIISLIREWGVPAAALVYGGGHWNVVCGVQTDKDPTTGNYIVDGLWLNNPVYSHPPPPPPHDATDLCGSGGIHGLGTEFVTYEEWQSRFTGFKFDDPANNDLWMYVCDPSPPTIQLPRGRPLRRLYDGRIIIPHDKVLTAARIGIDDLGLKKSEIADKVLSEGKIGDTKPQLVKRLDKRGSYYYLTPVIKDGIPTAFIQVDARFGFFKSLQILDHVSKGGSPIREWYANMFDASRKESIRACLDDAKFELPNRAGRATLRQGTYTISSTLVWKPCQESFSPSVPFYQIVSGESLVYMRVDGAIFTHLTLSELGD